MNIDDLRVGLTVVSFLVFVGIAIWAYSRRRQRDFDEAANLPFSEHDFDTRGAPTGSKEHNR